MNPLQQLRSTIDGLSSNDDLVRRKNELLALVDALQPYHGNGAGNGNGNGLAEGQTQRLSPREREVMNMILSGRRLKEIAATLDISVKTVTTHRSRLLRKLGLDDNLGLYRYGVRNGLISV
ncbi:MAG TPA: LuxR C-terminal-related transcriptional regulator [Thermoanaerobaculia bacterium]|nr:LuxR C-terminal-related transcriptional regulator [Thermoanaerobaculia bacterium]